MNAMILETEGLTRTFGSLRAVDEVSINVAEGEIYGFLGLNGAGKTTTIRMLLGMIRPDTGAVRVCGERIVPGGRGPWERVGYMVETPSAYPELTVRENLWAMARLRRLHCRDAVDKIIASMRLGAYAQVKARNLSLGNSQRLGLAKALIHDPELIVLDEPANGLDPSGIVEIRELLRNYALNRGKTVFISSHNLSEISRIATRIGIIHNGRLVEEVAADALGSRLDRTLVIDARDRDMTESCLAGAGYSTTRTSDGMLCVSDLRACEHPDAVNSTLVRAGTAPTYLNVVREDLESYFLRVIRERV